MFKIRLRTYLTVFSRLTAHSLQVALIHRGSTSLFILGKSIRFGMSLLFLALLRSNQVTVGTYAPDQVLIFFFTYHFLDLTSQMLYRGVYSFSWRIRSGSFDALLLRPINPLSQALIDEPDINDLLFFLASIGVVGWLLPQTSLAVSGWPLLWFAILFLNGFMIITGLHILILTVSLFATDVEGIIWLYRDFVKLGQLPAWFYPYIVRFALFFIIPVGIMITIPADVLLGNLPPLILVPAACIGLGFWGISLGLWKWGLRFYNGASS